MRTEMRSDMPFATSFARLWRGLPFVLLAGLLATAGWAVPPESGSAEDRADVLVDARAVDQHGESHRWAPPFGQPMVIDFAASWCAPCRHSLPRLERFAGEHPEVGVLVVSVDEERAGAEELVSSLGLRLPVLWDRGHEIAARYRPPAMPTTFLLAADGRVLHAAEGSSEEEWAELVAAAEEAASRAAGTDPSG